MSGSWSTSGFVSIANQQPSPPAHPNRPLTARTHPQASFRTYGARPPTPTLHRPPSAASPQPGPASGPPPRNPCTQPPRPIVGQESRDPRLRLQQVANGSVVKNPASVSTLTNNGHLLPQPRPPSRTASDSVRPPTARPQSRNSPNRPASPIQRSSTPLDSFRGPLPRVIERARALPPAPTSPAPPGSGPRTPPHESSSAFAAVEAENQSLRDRLQTLLLTHDRAMKEMSDSWTADRYKMGCADYQRRGLESTLQNARGRIQELERVSGESRRALMRVRQELAEKEAELTGTRLALRAKECEVTHNVAIIEQYSKDIWARQVEVHLARLSASRLLGVLDRERIECIRSDNDRIRAQNDLTRLSNEWTADATLAHQVEDQRLQIVNLEKENRYLISKYGSEFQETTFQLDAAIVSRDEVEDEKRELAEQLDCRIEERDDARDEVKRATNEVARLKEEVKNLRASQRTASSKRRSREKELKEKTIELEAFVPEMAKRVTQCEVYDALVVEITSEYERLSFRTSSTIGRLRMALKDVRAELDAKSSRGNDLETALAGKQLDNDDLSKRLEDVKKSADYFCDGLNEKAAALDVSQKDLVKAQAELQSQTDELQRLRRDLDTRSNELTQAKASANANGIKVEDLSAKLDESKLAEQEMRQALTNAEEEIEVWKDKAEMLGNSLKTLQGGLENQMGVYRDLETSLATKDTDLSTMSTQLADHALEIKKLQASLIETTAARDSAQSVHQVTEHERRQHERVIREHQETLIQANTTRFELVRSTAKCTSLASDITQKELELAKVRVDLEQKTKECKRLSTERKERRDSKIRKQAEEIEKKEKALDRLAATLKTKEIELEGLRWAVGDAVTQKRVADLALLDQARHSQCALRESLDSTSTWLDTLNRQIAVLQRRRAMDRTALRLSRAETRRTIQDGNEALICQGRRHRQELEARVAEASRLRAEVVKLSASQTTESDGQQVQRTKAMLVDRDLEIEMLEASFDEARDELDALQSVHLEDQALILHLRTVITAAQQGLVVSNRLTASEAAVKDAEKRLRTTSTDLRVALSSLDLANDTRNQLEEEKAALQDTERRLRSTFNVKCGEREAALKERDRLRRDRQSDQDLIKKINGEIDTICGHLPQNDAISSGASGIIDRLKELGAELERTALEHGQVLEERDQMKIKLEKVQENLKSEREKAYQAYEDANSESKRRRGAQARTRAAETRAEELSAALKAAHGRCGEKRKRASEGVALEGAKRAKGGLADYANMPVSWASQAPQPTNALGVTLYDRDDQANEPPPAALPNEARKNQVKGTERRKDVIDLTGMDSEGD